MEEAQMQRDDEEKGGGRETGGLVCALDSLKPCGRPIAPRMWF